MKKTHGHRLAMAWAMLLTLLIVGGVKATHVHAHVGSAVSSEASEASHCADDCAVCHFLLSAFVVGDAPRLVVETAAALAPLAAAAECLASAELPPPTSRGPPAASRL